MALIKCEDCGKEISDKSKACIHCGCPINLVQEKENNKDKEVELEKVKDHVFCIGCGNKMSVKDKFCIMCGRAVEGNAPSNKCRFRDLDEVTKNRIIQYRKFNKEWNVGKRPVIWAWCIAIWVLILFSLLLPFLWIAVLPLLIVYLVMCFGPWRGICFDEDDAWYELNYERLKREKII